nr:retrotransposon protein putative Ty1-copia subclass [Tanacetum cinerariifolium]
MGYYFYFLPKNKIVVARYGKLFEKNLLSQEVSGRAGDLKEIQDEDTSPSEITSKIPIEFKGFEPPHEEEAHVRRSDKPHRAPNCLFLNVEVKEHSLWDLNEPAKYKAAMLASGRNVTFLILYVDNIIVMGNHIPGSIMYAVRCTRPDVAFVKNITSRFQQNPGEIHWTTVKTILKYLRDTKDMFLVYGGNHKAELRVDCYCDAGSETDRDDTKSQTEYVFILNGGAVDWKSSKQVLL